MSGRFVCNTCKLVFPTTDLHRQHYKTEWHRYNLKREIAGMATVTLEKFQALVSSDPTKKTDKDVYYCSICDPQMRTLFKTENALLSHKRSEKHAEALKAIGRDPDEDSDAFPKKNYFCTICRKPFGTENSYINHSLSKKHLDQIKKNLESEQQPMSANPLEHMTKRQDSMEVEDDEDEENEDGEEWDDVEGEPLAIEECLFCSFKSANLEENVKHMVSDHSFFIPDIEFLVDLEGLVKYLGEKIGVDNRCLWCSDKGRPFYSSKAVQNHMLDKGHCNLLHEGKALLEYSDFYDYSSSYPEGAGENVDEEVEEPVLEADDYQLKLPSGAVIGHRSLMVYYKQKLPAEKAIVKKTSALQRVLGQYKALGWTGTTGEAAKRHARDITFMKRYQMKHYMRLGVKANKLQKHFRQQVDF